MEFSRKGPLNDVFLAINHYISTGDHLGEGIATRKGTVINEHSKLGPGDQLLLMIAVNQTDPVDKLDFEKFKSRLAQIAGEFDAVLEVVPIPHPRFTHHTLSVSYVNLVPLARKLTEAPGPLGWGSMKPLIDKHMPG